MKESPRFREFTKTASEKAKKNKPELIEEDAGDQEISQSERAVLLREVMTPDLKSGYEQILSKFKVAKIGAFVDLESCEQEIEQWIEKLTANAKASEKYKDWDEEDFEGLEAEAWNFFDSVARVVNTRIIEDEIKSTLSRDAKDEELSREDRLYIQREVQSGLVEKFGVTPAEAGIIFDAVATDTGRREYSISDIAVTTKKIWKEYEMSDQSVAMSKVAGGRLLQTALQSFQPYLFTNLLPEEGGMNVSVFLEMFGLNKMADLVNFKVGKMQNLVQRDMERKINTRTVEYMFYSDFEMMDEHTLGETLNTIRRGTRATIGMMNECMSYSGPAVATIGMSAAFLASIQPIMGAIGVSSLPVIYAIAKKHSRERRKMYRKEKDNTDAVDTRLSGVKSSAEEIMTSPHAEFIAKKANDLLEEKSDVSLASATLRQWQSIKEEIPLDISHLVSLGVGYSLYQQGLISPGAVISNSRYVSAMQRPVEHMLQTLMDDLSKNVQDIDRLESMLGKYKDLDRPGGEQENSRVSISERKDNGIKIKNLSVRGILEKVNIEIASGETVIIRGPSGVGKTTLLRAIAGLYKATSGGVFVGEKDSRDYKKFGNESIRSLVAYATQKPNMVPDMTLRENLTMWSKPDATDEEIKKVLTELKLGNLIGRLDDKTKLSGGELVRFGLARVLLRNPEILLLDEPTASLDPKTSLEVRHLIKELKSTKPGMTVICVSHDENLSDLGREIILNKKII